MIKHIKAIERELALLKRKVQPFSVDIDLHGATIIYDVSEGSPGPFEGDRPHYHYLVEDNHDYGLTCDGVRGENYDMWITSGEGLGVRVYPSTRRIDRAELRISALAVDEYVLKWGEERTVSFDMTVHSSSEWPQKAHFFQVWQPECWKSVPLTLTMFPEGKWEAQARTNSIRKTFAQGTLKSGPNHFELILRPDIYGSIQIDHNGDIFEYEGQWGELPDHAILHHDEFDVRCGIYREGQPTSQIVFFDNIKYQ